MLKKWHDPMWLYVPIYVLYVVKKKHIDNIDA